MYYINFNQNHSDITFLCDISFDKKKSELAKICYKKLQLPKTNHFCIVCDKSIVYCYFYVKSV